jgi:hypothetical protein
MLAGDLTRGRRIDVGNANQVHLRHLRVDTRVDAPEVTHADDPDAQTVGVRLARDCGMRRHAWRAGDRVRAAVSAALYRK